MLFLLLFQRISQKARSQYQADFLTFFFLLFSEQIIDKLLCGTAGKTAVGQFPFVRFCQKLFLTQRHAVSFGQCGNNLLEFFLIRCTKINADAETVGAPNHTKPINTPSKSIPKRTKRNGTANMEYIAPPGECELN